MVTSDDVDPTVGVGQTHRRRPVDSVEMKLSVARRAIRIRAEADALLDAVGITRDGSGLVGQLAELLVARALDGTLAPPVQAGYDVLAGDGHRVQAKGRLGAPGERGKHVFMRGLNALEQPFDDLVYVQFTPDFDPALAVRFEFATIRPLARYVPRMNSWRVLMTAATIRLGSDITPLVREAFERL